MKKSRLLLLPALTGVASLLVMGTASADIFVSNNGGNNVVDVSGGTQTVVASSGLDGPTGLTFDDAGDLFVANNYSGTVEEYSGAGATTYATGLSNPRGLVFNSSDGSLFVANQSAGTVDEIAPGGVVIPFADGLNTPNGLAINSAGTIFVAEGSNANTIAEISPAGTVSTFATGGALNDVNGLAFDAAGNLFVLNNGDQGGTANIEEFMAGPTPGSLSSTGVIYATAGLDNPKDLAFDSDGNLYVTNPGNDTVTEYNEMGESVFATDLNYPCFITSTPGTSIPNEVPEPSTYALLAASLGVILFMARRKALKA